MVSKHILEICQAAQAWNGITPQISLANTAVLLAQVHYHRHHCDPQSQQLLQRAYEQMIGRVDSALIPEIFSGLADDGNITVQDTVSVKILFDTLKQRMLSDAFYLRSIDSYLIIDAGRDLNWTRIALMALVQRHLSLLRQPDPFSNLRSNLDLPASETQSKLSSLYKRCSGLPIDSIVAMGQTSAPVARTVLQELLGTSIYFQVGARLTAVFPTMRTWIAQQWQNFVRLQPPDDESQQFLQEQLLLLRSKYPEFLIVDVEDHAYNHSADIMPYSLSTLFSLNWNTMTKAITAASGAASAVACAYQKISAYHRLLQVVQTVNTTAGVTRWVVTAAPLTPNPVLWVALGLGAGYAASNAMQLVMDSPKKPTPRMT